MKAYAWASGRIDFGRSVPAGAILIAEAPAKKLRPLVEVLARHGKGKSDGLLLVPGIPEAANQRQGGDALAEFNGIVNRSLKMVDLSADAFNLQFPVGTAVRYFDTIWTDKHLDSVTRSEAWELGHGAPVVKIEGKTGGVLLSHLQIVRGAA